MPKCSLPRCKRDEPILIACMVAFNGSERLYHPVCEKHARICEYCQMTGCALHVHRIDGIQVCDACIDGWLGVRLA